MRTQRRVLAGKGRDVVIANLKFACSMFALICIAVGAAPKHALAITAEIARKCNALTARQFPPREPGNPAAGSAKGSGRAQQEYFNKCVANGGKVDDNAVPK
jgi:hypothetical protein